VAAIFPKWTLKLPLLLGVVLPVGGTATVAGAWYYMSPVFTDVGYAPKQPVPYSHKQHAGDLGMDCRYCHNTVERAAHAAIPPTATCMNCHHSVLKEDSKLAGVIASAASGEPIAWVRAHKIPDFAVFEHSPHLAAGVGCVSCHGRVDQMKVVYQAEPLSMGWCLACHRDPSPHLRPPAEVTNMSWTPPPEDSGEQAAAATRALAPPTHCSGCHQ